MVVDERVTKALDMKAIKLPESVPIVHDTMRANFIMFPSSCRRVYALIDHFASNAI